MVLYAKTFRTEVSIRPLSHAPLLRHEEPLLLLGSCFSEGVGGRLQAAGHDALANPLGTLFSPASIRRATELLADGPAASWDPPRLDERSGLWYTFDAGATITHPTQTGCEAAVAEALAAGHSQLRRSSCLFVTLGSAWSARFKVATLWPRPGRPHLGWRRLSELGCPSGCVAQPPASVAARHVAAGVAWREAKLIGPHRWGYAHEGRVVANCHKQPHARWWETPLRLSLEPCVCPPPHPWSLWRLRGQGSHPWATPLVGLRTTSLILRRSPLPAPSGGFQGGPLAPAGARSSSARCAECPIVPRSCGAACTRHGRWGARECASC